MRPGVHEHRPRQRRRAAFQEAPCGALAPCLGDAGQHLPGPEGDQLRLLDAPLAFGAAFIERRAFRRDRRQLGRPAVGRRRAQGAEKLPHRLGVGRRRDRRDCGIALDLLDLRAERLDDGVVDLRLVELGGDEVEQQAPVGGSALDVGRRARGLGGCAYREHHEHDAGEQRGRVAGVPVHGGAGSRGRQHDHAPARGQEVPLTPEDGRGTATIRRPDPGDWNTAKSMREAVFRGMAGISGSGPGMLPCLRRAPDDGDCTADRQDAMPVKPFASACERTKVGCSAGRSGARQHYRRVAAIVDAHRCREMSPRSIRSGSTVPAIRIRSRATAPRTTTEPQPAGREIQASRELSGPAAAVSEMILLLPVEAGIVR